MCTGLSTRCPSPRRLIGSAILLLLIACGETPTEPRSALAGSWNWVQSSGGIQGNVLTPETEGYSVTLVLGSDGRALALREREVVGEAAYSLEERLVLTTPGSPREYAITFDPALPLFDFAAAQSFTVRLSESGELVLESPCCDHYDHTFTVDRWIEL